jgi:hypothetical protein
VSTILSAVLTAEDHRRIPADCDCEWRQPWPGRPWVLTTPNPRCRAHRGTELSQHAGRRTFWQMQLDATEARMSELKALAARARDQLTKLGGAAQ